MFKVVSIDAHRFPPISEPEILREIGAEFSAYHCKNFEEILEVTRDADGVMVSLSRITRPLVETWQRMKIIARYGVGFDGVDLEAATEHGIFVTNVPDFCTEEVADTTWGLILALWRKLIEMDRLIRQGTYNRMSGYPIYRLRGRTLGIIGFGRIGTSVARRAIPFGLRIITCDPYLDPAQYRDFPVEFVSLDELLRQSDIVSLHAPLTDETRHMMGTAQFEMMKPQALMINAARGKIVDQPALCDALRRGRILGAGLDVLETEPPLPGDPILTLPNVVITPHYGSYSEEAYLDVRAKAARQVVQALKGEIPTCLVNPEVLKRRGRQ